MKLTLGSNTETSANLHTDDNSIVVLSCPNAPEVALQVARAVNSYDLSSALRAFLSPISIELKNIDVLSNGADEADRRLRRLRDMLETAIDAVEREREYEATADAA